MSQIHFNGTCWNDLTKFLKIYLVKTEKYEDTFRLHLEESTNSFNHLISSDYRRLIEMKQISELITHPISFLGETVKNLILLKTRHKKNLTDEGGNSEDISSFISSEKRERKLSVNDNYDSINSSSTESTDKNNKSFLLNDNIFNCQKQ